MNQDSRESSARPPLAAGSGGSRQQPDRRDTLHPVLELLAARSVDGGGPSARRDRHVLALAVEGGGMRGVVAAGMVAELERLGLRDCFDHIYGTSSGSFAGAALLAGKAVLAERMYWERLTDRRFIDLRRMARGRPALSLEYLLHVIATDVDPMLMSNVLESPICLHPLAFSLDRFATVDLAGASTLVELSRALTASAQIPVVAGPPIEIGGQRLMDGSMLEPVPYRSAVASGASHVLVLATRPAGVGRESLRLVERTIVARALRRLHPGLVDLQRTRATRYNAALSELAELETATAEPPYLTVIRPPASAPTVSQLEQDPSDLRAGALSGAEAVRARLAEVVARYRPEAGSSPR